MAITPSGPASKISVSQRIRIAPNPYTGHKGSSSKHFRSSFGLWMTRAKATSRRNPKKPYKRKRQSQSIKKIPPFPAPIVEETRGSYPRQILLRAAAGQDGAGHHTHQQIGH